MGRNDNGPKIDTDSHRFKQWYFFYKNYFLCASVLISGLFVSLQDLHVLRGKNDFLFIYNFALFVPFVVRMFCIFAFAVSFALDVFNLSFSQ